MALVAGTVWEVRTTGSDGNGGGFNPNRSVNGVDRSQQNAAFITIDGVTITATVNATTTILDLTGVAAVNGHLGNLVNITGGTATAGVYEIVAIPSGTQWQLDRSAGTAGQTATGAMGGANATPGWVAGKAVSSNTIYIKAGTYAITSASTNIAGGCVATALGGQHWEGYQTTRGDWGTAPLLQASGINTATIFSLTGNDSRAINLRIDGASLVAIRGISFAGRTTWILCEAFNCTNSGFFTAAANGAFLAGCHADGCSTAGAAFNLTFGGTPGAVHACIAHANSVTGFDVDGITLTNCIARGNTGATSDGFDIHGGGTGFVNCTAYGNGRDGFNNSTNASGCHWLNCLSEGNVRNGFNAGTSTINITRIACGTFGNGTAVAGATIQISHFNFVGTSTFFVDAAGGDLTLNASPTGGGLARGTGFPVNMGGEQVTNIDVGAVQTAAGGSGGGGGSAIIGPGAPGWVL